MWTKMTHLSTQNDKDLHHEIIKFLNEIRINYKLFKKFIIMRNKIHNKFVPGRKNRIFV